MLPGHFARIHKRQIVLDAEHLRLQEILLYIGVAQIGGVHPDGVPLGRLPAMTDRQRIAVAFDGTAPVLIVPALRIRPMAFDAIVVVVQRVVDLEFPSPEGTELPIQRLTEPDAVLLAEVEARIAAKPPRAFLEAAGQFVDILRHHVRAPAARIARHHTPTIVRVKRIVPERKPEDRHVEKAQPQIADEDVIFSRVFEFAVDTPVQVVPVVRARGDVRRIGERQQPLLVAGHVIRDKLERPRDDPHVASGRKGAGLAIRGEFVGAYGHPGLGFVRPDQRRGLIRGGGGASRRRDERT